MEKKAGSINAKINKHLLIQVKNYAYTHNMKVYGVIEEALIAYLEKKGRYESKKNL